jgi:hypothetical protein
MESAQFKLSSFVITSAACIFLSHCFLPARIKEAGTLFFEIVSPTEESMYAQSGVQAHHPLPNPAPLFPFTRLHKSEIVLALCVWDKSTSSFQLSFDFGPTPVSRIAISSAVTIVIPVEPHTPPSKSQDNSFDKSTSDTEATNNSFDMNPNSRPERTCFWNIILSKSPTF